MRQRVVALAAAVAVLAIAPAHAGAAPSSSQRLFRGMLLEDPGTTDSIKRLLRSGGGFVDPRILFADLTGDRRSDAVVLVNSGGSAGAVALYVFSTQLAGGKSGPLRAVFHSQSLFRASARVTGGVLSYRSPRYAAGDDLCCPRSSLERRLRWSSRRGRFTVGAARRV